MRTLHNYHFPEPTEMACRLPSQIEPDGATSLRDVVQQYMSGIQPHQVSSTYFDFNAAIGGVPNIDGLPQIPHFNTMEEVNDYFNSLIDAKQHEEDDPMVVDPVPAPPAPTMDPHQPQAQPQPQPQTEQR